MMNGTNSFSILGQSIVVGFQGVLEFMVVLKLLPTSRCTCSSSVWETLMSGLFGRGVQQPLGVMDLAWVITIGIVPSQDDDPLLKQELDE